MFEGTTAAHAGEGINLCEGRGHRWRRDRHILQGKPSDFSPKARLLDTLMRAHVCVREGRARVCVKWCRGLEEREACEGRRGGNGGGRGLAEAGRLQWGAQVAREQAVPIP